MGDYEAGLLQRQIDEFLRIQSEVTLRIVLDHGSECTDLTQNVDVRVFRGMVSESVLVSFVTARRLYDMLAGTPNHGSVESDRLVSEEDYYYSGGPLIVTREITADVIVRAICRHWGQ